MATMSMTMMATNAYEYDDHVTVKCDLSEMDRVYATEARSNPMFTPFAVAAVFDFPEDPAETDPNASWDQKKLTTTTWNWDWLSFVQEQEQKNRKNGEGHLDGSDFDCDFIAHTNDDHSLDYHGDGNGNSSAASSCDTSASASSSASSKYPDSVRITIKNALGKDFDTNEDPDLNLYDHVNHNIATIDRNTRFNAWLDAWLEGDDFSGAMSSMSSVSCMSHMRGMRATLWSPSDSDRCCYTDDRSHTAATLSRTESRATSGDFTPITINGCLDPYAENDDGYAPFEVEINVQRNEYSDEHHEYDINYLAYLKNVKVTYDMPVSQHTKMVVRDALSTLLMLCTCYEERWDYFQSFAVPNTTAAFHDHDYDGTNTHVLDDIMALLRTSVHGTRQTKWRK